MREIKTDLRAILDTACLMDEDRGTTGALVREYLYKMAGGSISDDEVKEYVKARLDVQLADFLAKTGRTEAQWRVDWEKLHPDESWEENNDEEEFLMGNVMETVTLMRGGD